MVQVRNSGFITVHGYIESHVAQPGAKLYINMQSNKKYQILYLVSA